MSIIGQYRLRTWRYSYISISELDMDHLESPLKTDKLRRRPRRRLVSSDKEDFTRREEVITLSISSAPKTSPSSGSANNRVGTTCTPSKKRKVESVDSNTQGSKVQRRVKGKKSKVTLHRQESRSASPSHKAKGHEWSAGAGKSDRPSQTSQKQDLEQQQSRSPTHASKNSVHENPHLEQELEEERCETVDGEGVVIFMETPEEELIWDSEQDGDTSVTSTPDCKCGRHLTGRLPDCDTSPILPQQQDGYSTGSLHDLAVLELVQEGEAFLLGDKVQPLSAHLLVDSMVKHWPMGDHVISVEFRPGWDLKQWLSALRAEVIRITCGTVILYLEKTQDYSEVAPLKNNLQAVCKVIRQHNRNTRIFIVNMLPKPSHSPVSKGRLQTDFVLLQAIRSLNRSMGKIHYLSIFEHFISKKGHIIRLTHKYYQESS